ncbi:hypothetical protein JKP88DRAFT_286163, partial [Tribonema minus]
LFQGLLDALDTEVEIIEGCKREVRELAADAPNREFTIVEVVNLVHHLYQHASHLSNALGEYMHHRSREPAVAITRKWERLHRLGGGVQRFPMTQEETTAVRERLSAVSSCRWECRTFIEEHMPVLMRHDAAPWARFYPLWEQRHQPPQPKPRRRSPEELQALWARFWQWQEQQEDIANAPYVFAKFRSRPRRVPHRRIDPVPPRGARTRVSAPATAAAAAAEAAAGPLLPDGERVVQRHLSGSSSSSSSGNSTTVSSSSSSSSTTTISSSFTTTSSSGGSSSAVGWAGAAAVQREPAAAASRRSSGGCARCAALGSVSAAAAAATAAAAAAPLNQSHDAPFGLKYITAAAPAAARMGRQDQAAPHSALSPQAAIAERCRPNSTGIMAQRQQRHHGVAAAAAALALDEHGSTVAVAAAAAAAAAAATSAASRLTNSSFIIAWQQRRHCWLWMSTALQ